MQKGKGRHGISKAEWLEAGLQALSEGGTAALSIEALAKSLGTAKAGFYWHFKNRDELLRQLLDHWTDEITEVVTSNPDLLALKPKSQLIMAAEMILDYDLTRYEIAIRQWALQDAEAARAVRKANRLRLEFARNALSKLGFKGDDLEMRAMLFVCYHSWESPMFREISRKRRRELITKRIELLTGK
ncbi:MAG: TetR/AcrR family transcriptional regulator [Betaproteobacteria bacterium]|nr:MAG: TetR/AcrR family transcriptional regulator [Betaproteobacteria bacterium]